MTRIDILYLYVCLPTAAGITFAVLVIARPDLAAAVEIAIRWRWRRTYRGRRRKRWWQLYSTRQVQIRAALYQHSVVVAQWLAFDRGVAEALAAEVDALLALPPGYGTDEFDIPALTLGRYSRLRTAELDAAAVHRNAVLARGIRPCSPWGVEDEALVGAGHVT